MRIALYNLEPKIENTAMMQVSHYHKSKGDSIELYNPLFHAEYDKIYAFSLFDFTDKGYVTEDMITGGTGFDIKKKLPHEIERSKFDYSIFHNCKTSYIWFSKGCFRRCGFCIVWKKDGHIHSVDARNINPKGKYISVMDDNFFGHKHWREAIQELKDYGQPTYFNSGIDVRIFKREHGLALQKLRLHKQLHIAWDNPKNDLIPKIKELIKYIKAYRIMCYVLIGYDSNEEEDLYRVEELRKIGVDPFVMPYRKDTKYLRAFPRWVNRKEIFKTVAWKEYTWRKAK